VEARKNINIPLCVDLDGTLIATDCLSESIIDMLRKNFFLIFLLPIWLLKGKSVFKEKVVERVIPNPEDLPYNKEIIEYLNLQKEDGRKLILITASHQRIAARIGESLEIFDEVIGSDLNRNTKGKSKQKYLVDRYGEKGFDYAGDSKADLYVWKSARKGIIVHPKDSVLEKANKIVEIEKVFYKEKSGLMIYLKQIRVYQWIKNILIFLPLLMAHKISEPILFVDAIIAFFAFSFTASFVYVLNDLVDLPSDRKHPRKKNRPLASGKIPILHGAIISPFLLLIGILLSVLFLSNEFLYILIAYLIITSLYSFVLKKIYILDIIVLSILYTIRLIAGALAVDVPLSQWLMEFSVFFFLSLAINKRFTELYMMQKKNKENAAGRGYTVSDIDLMRVIGPVSGYISVLVFVLYLHSDEVVVLYKNAHILWLVAVCLLYWITRIWFITTRGKMHDDPIIFTGKDPVSYIIGIIVALLVIGAAL
jgi:4-hydroxybenzoate polyprenyltransferase